MGAGSRRALPKEGEIAPFPQALRPALQVPERARGLPPHRRVENKGFGCTSLRLNPDTVAYSVCDPGGAAEPFLACLLISQREIIPYISRQVVSGLEMTRGKPLGQELICVGT